MKTMLAVIQVLLDRGCVRGRVGGREDGPRSSESASSSRRADRRVRARLHRGRREAEPRAEPGRKLWLDDRLGGGRRRRAARPRESAPPGVPRSERRQRGIVCGPGAGEPAVARLDAELPQPSRRRPPGRFYRRARSAAGPDGRRRPVRDPRHRRRRRRPRRRPDGAIPWNSSRRLGPPSPPDAGREPGGRGGRRVGRRRLMRRVQVWGQMSSRGILDGESCFV